VSRPKNHPKAGDELRRAEAAHHAGRAAEAERLYRSVLSRDPANPAALHSLGILTCQAGNYESAIALIDKALRIAPNEGAMHNTRAVACWKIGRHVEAMESWRRALALDPRLVEALVNLAVAVAARGDRAEAARLYEDALAVEPGSMLALNNLAILRLLDGRAPEAIALCERALTHTRDAGTLSTLGTALRREGRLTDALAAFEEAARLEPDRSLTYVGMSSVVRSMRQPDEALTLCRRAVQLDGTSVRATDTLLFTLLFVPDLPPAAHLAELIRWDTSHGLPLAQLRVPHTNDRDPARPLRVGYVSPDFRDHAVAHFAEPLLAGHDRAAFTVIAYSSVGRADAVTERLAGLPDAWRDISGMGDDEVAALVRADGIDVLVDLACHTGGNRLPVFARKPAPVQISHNVTPSGLSAIDYLIADAHLAPSLPPGVLAETIVRLPRCFTSYLPPTDAPAPAPPPALSRGVVTFGSFNNLAKVNEKVVALWAEVLRAVPGSRLAVKSSSAVDRATQRDIVAAFAALGLGDRIDCLDSTAGRNEHLAQYAQIDIALDTFPFNGHTTTCEALWMGVPVVTLAGHLFADRVGVSFLNAIELPELVAHTPDEYVQLAVELASDVARLETVRGVLRDHVARSSLCDTAGYLRILETAYREAWRRWCVGTPTEMGAPQLRTPTPSLDMGATQLRTPKPPDGHRLEEHPAQAS
jgi:predicted O-linked N-acetylglucosamine transferase (SPINDLY family)